MGSWGTCKNKSSKNSKIYSTKPEFSSVLNMIVICDCDYWMLSWVYAHIIQNDIFYVTTYESPKKPNNHDIWYA